jgi:hypothetical protein
MNSILTVTTAAETQDLTILATVKAEFGITDTSEDAKLATWIKQASGMIAVYCNRVFGFETVSEAFRLDTGYARLRLARFPIAAITSVTEDGEVLDTSDYEIDSEAGLLMRLSEDELWSWPATKITVAYSAGYELLDGLPQDIERACITLVRHLRASSTRDPMAKREEIPDVRTVDYWVGQVGKSGSMPPDVAAILDFYRPVRS